MAYKKLLIDNTTCSRRFHLTFDDDQASLPRVEIRCQLCNAVIFSEENHPPVKLAREENLTKTSVLAEMLVSTCNFEDKLSQATIPEYKGKDVHVYPRHLQKERRS